MTEPGLARGPFVLVLDWGIGGLDVFRRLSEGRPRAGLVYLSDSGSLPYGKMSRAALRARMEAIVSAFASRGAVAVVVACNAASTAFPSARVPEGVPVHDVISSGVALVRASGHREIGLVGGVRTVLSRAHAQRLGDVRVVARVAQPLSAMVERGELSGSAVSREVRRAVADLRALPAVLLACTHYPALLPVFREALPGVALLDPAALLAERVRASGLVPEGGGEPSFFTTGDPDEMRRSALAAFGVTLGPVHSARALVGIA